MIKNDRFLKALLCEPVNRTPLWIMRQAGRYLPEYRKVREQAKDFLTLCKTPELACEVTLQPIRRFGFDAAIIFSDILTIPDAMGLGLYFQEREGPKFQNPIRDIADIKKLSSNVSEKLDYVNKAVKLVKKELADSIPLIGFSGSPWTLACYMLEGESSKTFNRAKNFLYNEPIYLHQLLDLLSQAVADYLLSQIAAGADVVMLFDTWGGILTTSAYHEFSLHYMNEIIKKINAVHAKKIPIILFTKNGNEWLEDIVQTNCHAVGIDWTIDIASAKKRVGNKVALQGNLDPAILYSSQERIREEVKKILKSYGDAPGHIFNLGHGIYPDTPISSVETLVDAVKNIVIIE